MTENTNTPLPITGYRELTKREVSLINAIKAKGDDLGGFIELLSQTQDIDQRWVAIGRTHAQQAIMALVRAVAKPTNF